EKSVGLADSLPAEKPPADMFPSSSRNLAMLENHERQDSPHRHSDQERRDLAKQISKAIENRAILNVHVSVVDGIAYLDGRVATAQQRNAAERAARGVPQVREIRNRIAVE
ncbi:MAG TPA: BON domain-containing protein, partial [Candidatus Binatia bacterium]|nr:BON domain-containing protein [Candidatus Binatia bacterium]